MVRLPDEITLHRPSGGRNGKKWKKPKKMMSWEWIKSQVHDAILRQSTCLSPVEAAVIGQLLGRGACGVPSKMENSSRVSRIIFSIYY